MGVLRTAALAAVVAASGVQAFAPAAPASLHLAGHRAAAPLRGAAGTSMQAQSAVNRRQVVSGALAAAVLGAGSPAFADMLKAKCTTQSCPDAPDSNYKIDTLVVNKGKFTGVCAFRAWMFSTMTCKFCSYSVFV